MQLAMIGLCRMGANMVRHLLRAGHDVAVFDVRPKGVGALAADGASGAASLEELMALLSPGRVVWIMLPAALVDGQIERLGPLLAAGDIVVDGGNSRYRADLRRAEALQARGIEYVDVGVSGGYGVSDGVIVR